MDSPDLEMCLPIGTAQVRAAPEGLRRWARGRWAHDYTYWSFADYLDWVQQVGLAEDRDGNKGFWAAAQDLWRRSVAKETEAEWLQRSRAGDVAALRCAPLQELVGGAGGVVFEVWEGEKKAPGNSMRALDDGEVDFSGGSGPRSRFAVEAAPVSSPNQHVRLRSTHLGDYLCLREDGRLDCRGTAQSCEGTVFEVLVRDSPTPLVSLAAVKGGRTIGTFVPREAPSAPWWRERLLAEARAWVGADPGLGGRRRHIDDPNREKFYSFEEFVVFADTHGWGGPIENGALLMARLAWKHSCVPEHCGPRFSGRRWHPHDADQVYYTFDEWVDYVNAQGWATGIPGGVMALAEYWWERDLVPEGEGEDWRHLPADSMEGDLPATDEGDWDMVGDVTGGPSE